MLTAKKVEREKRPGRYRDGHIRGLYLQIGPTGGKSWLLRFERDGRERWLGLGPGSVVAQGLRVSAPAPRASCWLDGIDPIDHRKAEKAKLGRREGQAADLPRGHRGATSISTKASGGMPSTGQQFLDTLKQYAFPMLGSMSVAEIDTPAVLRAIEPIWRAKTETASRVRGRIEAVLDWCTVRGYRTGDNPARWKGHLSEVLPARGQVAKVNHHAACHLPSVPPFMAELRKREGVAARALEFAIFSAARTGEVIGANGPRSISTTKLGRFQPDA